MELARRIQNLPRPVRALILDKCTSEELGRWRQKGDIPKKIVDDYLPFPPPNQHQSLLSRTIQWITLADSPQTKRFKDWLEGRMIEQKPYKEGLPIKEKPSVVEKLLQSTKDPLWANNVNALCLISDKEFLVGTLYGEIYRRFGEQSTCIVKLDGGNELYSSVINDIIQLREGFFACAIVGDETWSNKGGITFFNLEGKVFGHFRSPIMLDYLEVDSGDIIRGISKANQAIGKWRIGTKYLEGKSLVQGAYPNHFPVYRLDSVKKVREMSREIARTNHQMLLYNGLMR